MIGLGLGGVDTKPHFACNFNVPRHCNVKIYGEISVDLCLLLLRGEGLMVHTNSMQRT